MKKLNISLSVVPWFMAVSYEPCFLEERGGFMYIFGKGERDLQEHVFWRRLIFHYECYFDSPCFTFHNNYSKKHLVRLYIEDTVDFHYRMKFDNLISVFVHDNN